MVNKNVKKIVLMLTLLTSPFTSTVNLSAIFPSFTEQKTLPFLGAVELRKKQAIDLTDVLLTIKQQAEEYDKNATRALNKINIDSAQAQSQLKSVDEQEHEYLNKKLTILNNRKQNILDIQELWQEIIERLDQHSKLVKEIIEYLQAKKEDLKPVYSWKDFKDLQIQVSEHALKIESEKTKQDNLKKQRLTENEIISSCQKQLDIKKKEQSKILTQGDTQKTVPGVSIKFSIDLLEQEVQNLISKTEKAELSIKKIDFDSKYFDDYIEHQHNVLNDEKSTLAQVENRLILDFNDVETARTEWLSEAQKALSAKEQLDSERTVKKNERDQLVIEIDSVREKITKLLERGGEKSIDSYLLKSELEQLTTHHRALERELLLIDAKKDLSDLISNDKEVQYRMVEMHFKIKTDEEDLDEQRADFRNRSDTAASSLRSLKKRQDEAIASLNETNRTFDKIKAAQDEIRSRKNINATNRESTLQEALANYDEAKDYLNKLLALTQDYLAVNSDLIAQQEKINHQYDLIITNLEAQKITQNVWKRSPKAISLSALQKSLAEAKIFFVKLFWETPTYFGLSVFIERIKNFKFHDIILLFLFVLFYIVAYLCIRFMLRIIHRKTQQWISMDHHKTRFLYAHIVAALVDFLLENYLLAFTWFFLFLHIMFDFSYIFSTIRTFVYPHTVALFYLASIPILVHLSRELLGSLKDLNKRLSYLFFTEQFQDKFLLLIASFCYSSAILIPLRAAYIGYGAPRHADFAVVILAAYSLILLIVLSLFFSKEDILRLLPSRGNSLIWIKRKIDRHYYPVFLFIMGLLILSNPYIGYSNLSWFLSFAVPLSVVLILVLFKIHFYIRKYAVFLFMKEEEEELIDKFDYAKAYYGFFVIFSFIILFFATTTIITNIWGLNYTPFDIWQVFANEWVINIGVDKKLGIIQFIIFGVFLAIGFVISSCTHKFVLSKLFDILRFEPGTQNTISRILHYLIIFVTILLGLYAIHLEQFIFLVGASLGIGLGFALKDVVADLVAGFFVLLERPIEIGNYIQLDNIEGTVHKIAARSTTIITSLNFSVIVPNKDLLSKTIINWGHGRFAVGFEVQVRVEHKTDPDLVKKVLFSVVQANPVVLRVPGIVVRLENFEENGYLFLVRAFISARRVKEYKEIAANLRMEILKAFKENNIQLSRPERAISYSVADGSMRHDAKSLEIKFDK